MNLIDQFLWVIYPYIVITVFLLGIYYRYQTDQFSWTSKSSEFLEKKKLKWGSLLFHWGIILVVIGHIGGLLIPKGFTDMIGISDEFYHSMALLFGSLAGFIAIVGLLVLAYRRFTEPQIRITSSFSDYLTLIVLCTIMLFGFAATITAAIGYHDFNYRLTIGPWIRSVLIFRPNPSFMLGVPMVYKIHVFLGITLFIIFPFTRLVHFLSFPIFYLWRSYILYRKKSMKRV